MPRAVPELTILIRPRGQRKFRSVEIFRVTARRIRLKIDGNWQENRRTVPVDRCMRELAAIIRTEGELECD